MIDTTKPPVDLITTPDGLQHYGAMPTFDPRNHSLAAYTPLAAAGAPLPSSFYPNLDGIPHWMQNKLGACVGHAAGKACQCMKFTESGATKITAYSARFLYAMAKCLEGTPGYTQYPRTASANDGTYPALVAQIMKVYGVATEATMPNDTTLDADTYCYNRNIKNIPAAAIAEAALNKISNYAFADITEQGIKAAIQFAAENRGAVFMLTRIDKAWWTAPNGNTSWDKKDLLTHFGGLRTPSDAATMGGHETMPFAFDEANGRSFLVDFNSWSDAWCDGGNSKMDLADWLPFIVQIITVFDLPSTYVADNFKYNFTRALSRGSQGSDVVALQHCLRIDGEFPASTSFATNFGNVTEAAVKAFQVKYASEILTPQGLTQPTGIVGNATLKKLNALFGIK